MAEEGADLLVAPEVICSSGVKLRRNSIAKAISGNIEDIVVPHYRRASFGSCHDFCKYGWKHASEVKQRHSMANIVPRSPLCRSSEEDVGGTKTVVANRRASVDSKLPKKASVVKLRKSVNSEPQISNASDTNEKELPTTLPNSQEQEKNEVPVPRKKTSLVKVKSLIHKKSRTSDHPKTIRQGNSSVSAKLVGTSSKSILKPVGTSSESTAEPVDTSSKSTVEQPVETSSKLTVELVGTSSKSIGEPVGPSSKSILEPVESSSKSTVEVIETASKSTAELIGASSKSTAKKVKASSKSTTKKVEASSKSIAKKVETSSKSTANNAEVSSRLTAKKVETSPKSTPKKVETSPRSTARKVETSSKSTAKKGVTSTKSTAKKGTSSKPFVKKVETSPKSTVKKVEASSKSKVGASSKSTPLKAEQMKLSEKHVASSKSNSVTVKTISSMNPSEGSSGQSNSKLKMEKGAASSKEAARKLMTPSRALLPSKPSLNRVASINARKHKNLKFVSHLKNQLKTRKYEHKEPSNNEVEEKTLYVIKMESGNKTLQFDQDASYDVEFSPPQSLSPPKFSSSSQEDKEESEYTTSEGKEDSFSVNLESEFMENGEALEVKEIDKPREVGIVCSEDKGSQMSKLNFRRGKSVELQSEKTCPRRLKFRRATVFGVNANIKAENQRRSFKRRYETDIDRIGTTTGPEKVVLRRQGVQGKRDAHELFNNVIEETASKLAEIRKSKVKALVGAFETVISLQERKPPVRTIS